MDSAHLPAAWGVAGGGSAVSVIQEGNRFGRFYKHCPCRSSASGPRSIIRGARVTKDQMEAEVMLVALACDECDTPWETTVPLALYAEETGGGRLGIRREKR